MIGKRKRKITYDIKLLHKGGRNSSPFMTVDSKQNIIRAIERNKGLAPYGFKIVKKTVISEEIRI